MPKKTKKKKVNVTDLLHQMQVELSSNSGPNIPDIITFCESPHYLGFTRQGIFLHPVQKIILKIFYRGSAGNENIELTDEEKQICEDTGMSDVKHGGVIEKFYNDTIFRELVLVWGRRSGKDFCASIISTYEAMRLVECKGGDPYKLYGISPDNPISILTIATAAKQADIAFGAIRSRILTSKYFLDKIGPDGLESTKICLLTPNDKKVNKMLEGKGLPRQKGSIAIEVGHSNSDTLLGKQCFVLLFDEVASYKQTGGSSSGERIHAALTPSLQTFGRTIKVKNEDDEEVEERVLDSKFICISSPRGEEGLFYRLYKEAHLTDSRLMCQLPTWKVNLPMTEKSLRETNTSMTDQDFMMEYGAVFSGSAGENFFVRDKVISCFKPQLVNKDMGEIGHVYFAHLDPATTSHNYSLAIVHKEAYLNKETKKADFRMIVDHIKYWHPTARSPINIEEIDEYVIALKRRFFLGMVTYDVWNSIQSIEKLKKHGIPSKCTHYHGRYKMAIYNQLEVLVNSNKIWIPRHTLLKNEMIYLQRKYTALGFKVAPSKEGEVRTDDCVDSLAGAVYVAMNAQAHCLPGSRLVSTGVVPSSNSITWRSMQGTPYGTGSGKQVSDSMETRQQNNSMMPIPPSVFRN